MTPPILDEIPDAKSKVDLLAQDQTARRVLGHRASVVSLCEAIGINRNTLNSQLKDSWISSEFQSALARHLRFSLDWREWTEGNAQAFIERYRSEHQVTAHAKHRQIDVRISRGPRQQAVVSKIAGLAAIEIDGVQFGFGTASIELKVSCGQPLIYGKGTTIRSGRIELKCYPALLSNTSHKRWMTSDSNVVGTKGNVFIAFEGATRDAPAWHLTAEGNSIGNIELDPDFASIDGLAPGDEITVVLGTWLSEVNDAETDDHDAIEIVEPDGSQLSEPISADLSKRKQRIIECLRKQLLPADDNGYVELARHTLRVVEAATG